MDAVASLAIAVLLVLVAIGLGRQNAEYLIGKAVSPGCSRASSTSSRAPTALTG